MSVNQSPRWSPSPNRILALGALVLFVLSAIAFAGDLNGANGHLLLAAGLACIAAESAL